MPCPYYITIIRFVSRPESTLQIFQRQCGELGFYSFVLSSGRNECHKLPLNGLKIDAAPIPIDLGDQQSSIQLILGNQINIPITVI